MNDPVIATAKLTAPSLEALLDHIAGMLVLQVVPTHRDARGIFAEPNMRTISPCGCC